MWLLKQLAVRLEKEVRSREEGGVRQDPAFRPAIDFYRLDADHRGAPAAAGVRRKPR